LGNDGQVPLFSFEGRAPQVSPQAWIAPTATLGGGTCGWRPKRRSG